MSGVLGQRAHSVELRGLNIEVSELGCAACPRGVFRTDTVRAAVNGQGVEINRRSAAAFRLTSDTPIRMNGREYPATLEIVRYGEGLAIVNELRLEEYIVGVLRAETSEKWPAETLRAQAIVARTYAAFLRSSSGTRPYNIVATTTHQVYAGHVPASSPIYGARQPDRCSGDGELYGVLPFERWLHGGIRRRLRGAQHARAQGDP
jgi:stage II sporulation protein D